MSVKTLVIEDDPAIQTLLAAVLRGREHEVTAVDSAEAALQQMELQRFDLMVVDWMLPGMDGLSLTRMVHERDPSVVLLVVTGRDQEGDLAQVLGAGANDYLAKPFTMQELEVRLAVNEARVTERRHRYRAEAELRAIVDSIPDAVVICDESRRVLGVNPGFTRLTGMQPSQIMGQSSERFYESKADFQEDAIRFSPQSSPTPYERRYRMVDGRSFLSESVTGPVRGPDGGIGWVTIFRDLTARREMAERLRMTDRLAQIGLLSSGVAHEINNPLTFVLINLNVLTQELRDMDPSGESAQIQDLIGVVEDAEEGCHRVGNIVKSMRSFARGDDHHPEKVVLQDLVDNSLVVMASSLRRRADVKLDYQPTPEVLAVPADLAQVILNLLKNAEEAIPKGEKGLIQIRIRGDEGQALLEIEDSGPGIPANVRARMFDAFYSTKGGNSTGLGLATAQSTVTRLGGVITCESRTGHGTVFKLRLPPA